MVSDLETVDFHKFLDSRDLAVLPSTGHFYSWSNKVIGFAVELTWVMLVGLISLV